MTPATDWDLYASGALEVSVIAQKASPLLAHLANEPSLYGRVYASCLALERRLSPEDLAEIQELSLALPASYQDKVGIFVLLLSTLHIEMVDLDLSVAIGGAYPTRDLWELSAKKENKESITVSLHFPDEEKATHFTGYMPASYVNIAIEFVNNVASVTR